MSLLQNELEKFSSYNYLWSLSVLDDTEYNNQSYVETSGTVFLVKSAGLIKGKAPTYIEQQLGLDLEFFIDDVQIETLISMNPGTSTTNAISYSFKVIEPNSIGLFYQAIFSGANKLGWANHLEAPYCLSLQFEGYDDAGNVISTQKKFFILQIVNLEFDINTQGSVYTITAVPKSSIALIDNVQQIQTDITLAGSTVQEIAKTGENSLEVKLNKATQAAVDSNQILVANKYIINFPNDIADGSQSNVAPSSTKAPLSLKDIHAFTSSIPVSNQPYKNTYDSNSNAFGNSKIIQNFTDFVNGSFSTYAKTVDPNNKKNIIIGDMHINTTLRQYTFNAGTKIENIIENLILTSEWGQNILKNVSGNDLVDWFKIDTKINILAKDNGAGKPAYELIYNVVPTKISNSYFSNSSDPIDYQTITKNLKKGYFYAYTGQNRDVLNFKINLNTSFYRPLLDLNNQNDQTGSSIVKAEKINQKGISATKNSLPPGTVPTSLQPTVRQQNTTGGSGKADTLEKLAKMYNNYVLNGDLGNVGANISIWGDPYYLTSSDSGNYKAKSQTYFIDSNNEIDYLRYEIYIGIYFNSIIDITNSGLVPIDNTNAFNGIYKVIKVTNKFSKGEFTQTLDLIRAANQSTATVNLSNAIITAFKTNNQSTAVGKIIQSTAGKLSSNVNPIVKDLPKEYQSFLLKEQAGIANFEKVFGTEVAAIFNQANNLIATGLKIKNNLLNSLGNLPNAIQGIENSVVSTVHKVESEAAAAVTGVTKELTNTVRNVENSIAKTLGLQNNINVTNSANNTTSKSAIPQVQKLNNSNGGKTIVLNTPFNEEIFEKPPIVIPPEVPPAVNSLLTNVAALTTAQVSKFSSMGLAMTNLETLQIGQTAIINNKTYVVATTPANTKYFQLDPSKTA